MHREMPVEIDAAGTAREWELVGVFLVDIAHRDLPVRRRDELVERVIVLRRARKVAV